jgi:hypothetical protein
MPASNPEASTRVAILRPKDRRAPTAHDVATIRAGVGSVDSQVLNGMDIVDRVLEGDVIETVEIVP